MIQTLVPLGLQAVEEVLQQELAPMPRPAREMALGLGNPVRYAIFVLARSPSTWAAAGGSTRCWSGRVPMLP